MEHKTESFETTNFPQIHYQQFRRDPIEEDKELTEILTGQINAEWEATIKEWEKDIKNQAKLVESLMRSYVINDGTKPVEYAKKEKPSKNTTTKDETHWDSGSEDGINWYVDFNTKDKQWIVNVEKNGEIKTESFSTPYPPKFGIDVVDSAQIEKLLDKFINEFKKKITVIV